MKKTPAASTVHRKSRKIYRLVELLNGESKDIKFGYGYSPVYQTIVAFNWSDYDKKYGTFPLEKKLFTISTKIEFFNMNPEDFKFDGILLETMNEIMKLHNEICTNY